ncbi:MAG: hypothetical protein GYB36_02025 [Alphaproteobacteria bacterium]|nr:hypothetical protein [Alphaproteobacteria bacterium]
MRILSVVLAMISGAAPAALAQSPEDHARAEFVRIATEFCPGVVSGAIPARQDTDAVFEAYGLVGFRAEAAGQGINGLELSLGVPGGAIPAMVETETGLVAIAIGNTARLCRVGLYGVEADQVWPMLDGAVMSFEPAWRRVSDQSNEVMRQRTYSSPEGMFNRVDRLAASGPLDGQRPEVPLRLMVTIARSN